MKVWIKIRKLWVQQCMFTNMRNLVRPHAYQRIQKQYHLVTIVTSMVNKEVWREDWNKYTMVVRICREYWRWSRGFV